MKPFTVVLLRPRYAEDKKPDDLRDVSYTSMVEAADKYQAVLLARREAFKADSLDRLRVKSAEDYRVLVVFEGRHEPVLFGWQL